MLRSLLASLFSFLKSKRSFSLSFPIKSTGLMRIQLTRLDITDKGIFGHLSFPGFDCVTLENDEKEVPCGTYKVTLYQAPTYGLCPLLHVPGRSYILLHPGNWETNSKGCILVGKNRNGYAVEHSRETFRLMMEKWPKEPEVEIEIK